MIAASSYLSRFPGRRVSRRDLAHDERQPKGSRRRLLWLHRAQPSATLDKISIQLSRQNCKNAAKAVKRKQNLNTAHCRLAFAPIPDRCSKSTNDTFPVGGYASRPCDRLTA
jgi:hypothetical protein